MKKRIFVIDVEDRLVSLREKRMEVVKVECDDALPYDRIKAQKELSMKKRRGEVSFMERLPKKRTLAQLRKEYENSTIQEIEDKERWNISSQALWKDIPYSDMLVLLSLCRSVTEKDLNFQNLNSEMEDAKRLAKEVEKIADQIHEIIERTKQEDAELAIHILQVMDIPYVRVFGDQMKYIPYRGTNLEDWIKYQHYKNERLKLLRKKEEMIQNIFTYSAV